MTLRVTRSRQAAPAVACRVAALALLASACASGGERRTFVERLGNDTTAVESYVRGPDGFEGDLVARIPATQLVHYAARLAGDGSVSRLDVDWRTPPENPEGRPPVSVTYTISGDSATVEVRARDTTSTTVAVPPGVIPIIGNPPWTYAIFEQAVMQAMDQSGDSVPVHFLTSRAAITPSVVRKIGADSASVSFFGYPVLARVDEQGHVLGRSGAQTTLKTEGMLVDSADIPALAADFAGRDARGEGMGVASPRDTIEATVDGATLVIQYSRPAMRGRRIWGSLVPYGEVWRTGANAATQINTDADLRIGETTIPAGTYTLWSTYTPDSARLIINKQTGQWGTEYNEDQDLARLPMSSESLAEPVERFTIGVEDTEGGGVLQLAWDGTRYLIPFTVVRSGSR